MQLDSVQDDGFEMPARMRDPQHLTEKVKRGALVGRAVAIETKYVHKTAPIASE
jgi:hypothetical protein